MLIHGHFKKNELSPYQRRYCRPEMVGRDAAHPVRRSRTHVQDMKSEAKSLRSLEKRYEPFKGISGRYSVKVVCMNVSEREQWGIGSRN